MEKLPDAKTLGKIGQAFGPEVIAERHAPLVKLAQAQGAVRGRKIPIFAIPPSRCCQDGARVLTRGMKRIEGKLGGLKKKVRNRMRSVIKVGDRHLACGIKGEGEEKREREYTMKATTVRPTRVPIKVGSGVRRPGLHVARAAKSVSRF